MHPLAPDLSPLSEDELHKKFNELQGRFTQAYRYGPTSVIPQLQMLIADYQEEMQIATAKVLKTLLTFHEL